MTQTSLRIALLTYSTKPRGSVVHTLDLAQALADLGHAVCVFALDKDGKGLYRDVGFKAYAVPAEPFCVSDEQGSGKGIDQLIKQRIGEFVAFFEQHDDTYDVYHAQDCLSANALAALKARGKIRSFVRTVHHIEAFKSPYLQDCQEKSIYQSDRCLCVSAVWQRVLKQEYGLDAHRVINGVSRRFSSERNGSEVELAQSYGLAEAAGPIYLTVGGIEPRKNSLRLLKAFGAVWRQHPGAKLVIAGGATLFDYQDYRREFMALAAMEGLEDALVLSGVVPDEDLPVLYRLADAFVFPSVQEGWGLVVLEAIASGLPVLTSHQAPFTEFLSAASALLIDPEDVNAIARGMADIIRSETAQQLIHHSRPILEHYRWEKSATMHLALYRQLVSTTRKDYA
ncbi:MAG: MSMEG_0565 family glycosyltransferase [Cyanobacteria bacterium P01_F01_bin.53]